jgi:hypothetical protein
MWWQSVSVKIANRKNDCTELRLLCSHCCQHHSDLNCNIREMPVSVLSSSPDVITVDCLGFPKSFQANDGNTLRLCESLFLKNPLPSFLVSVTTLTRLTSRRQLFVRCYSSCETCASIPFRITPYSLCEPPCIPFLDHPVFSFELTQYSFLGSLCILL